MEIEPRDIPPQNVWLYDYTKEEQLLRDYYLKNHDLMPNEIYNDRILEGAKAEDTTWRQILTDAMYISSNTDVSIVKHPRYLAPFDHSHTFFEISYVLSGSCQHTIQSYGGQESIHLQKGDVLILPPAITHSILAKGDSLVVNILMRKDTFNSTFLRGIPPNSSLSNFFMNILYADTYASFLLFRTKDSQTIYNAVHSILQEYCEGRAYTSSILNQLLGLFFLYLLRECGDRIEISKMQHSEMQCIPAILHYLEQQYATATISGLAKHLGYTVSHLCRLYKHHTGATLKETLWQIQMCHAIELLQKSSLSIEEIASMVGYRDASSFIRRFRSQLGVTPLQFRKKGWQ